MGFRFRKSINLGSGFRLNLGKRGVGISAGIRGFRVGVNRRGTYGSVGIPGTGMSYSAQGKGCAGLALLILLPTLACGAACIALRG